MTGWDRRPAPAIDDAGGNTTDRSCRDGQTIGRDTDHAGSEPPKGIIAIGPAEDSLNAVPNSPAAVLPVARDVATPAVSKPYNPGEGTNPARPNTADVPAPAVPKPNAPATGTDAVLPVVAMPEVSKPYNPGEGTNPARPNGPEVGTPAVPKPNAPATGVVPLVRDVTTPK